MTPGPTQKIANALVDQGNGLEVERLRGIVYLRIIGPNREPKSEWAEIEIEDLLTAMDAS